MGKHGGDMSTCQWMCFIFYTDKLPHDSWGTLFDKFTIKMVGDLDTLS